MYDPNSRARRLIVMLGLKHNRKALIRSYLTEAYVTGLAEALEFEADVLEGAVEDVTEEQNLAVPEEFNGITESHVPTNHGS